MPASKAQQAETAERRAKLVRFRRMGVPFDDPRILDLGYSSRGAASKDLIRALESNRDDEAAEVSVYRQQEGERLDSMLAALWPQATEERPQYGAEGKYIGKGVDVRAVDSVLRIIALRAKLFGLEMPAALEVSGPGGSAVRLDHVGLAELNTLITTAGDPDGPDEDQGEAYDTEENDDDHDAS
ncbi:hypothetical protein [Streptomyces hydrogenans]|uniref:hypothetical protein n=1 Tax=Streptomyces hydrogenans TaxID=1873719 RepID=UPI0036E113B9